jgi:ABC-2 type transport system permease protein
MLRKTLRDHGRLVGWWGFGLFAMFAMELVAYKSFLNSFSGMKSMIDAIPEAFKTMFRMEDYGTPSGFLGTEMYSFIVQLVFIAIGASFGAAATAGEEDRGTADTLFALPVTRHTILLAKMLALLVATAALCAAVVVFMAIAMPLADMQASLWNIGVATVGAGMLGLVAAGVAYLLGAWSGKRGLAIGGATAISIASFLIYSLAPLVTIFDRLIDFVPWQWAFGGNPLRNGADWPHLALLALVTAVLFSAALLVFERRDIEA